MTLPVWQGLAAQESSGDIVVLASPSVTVTDRTTGAQPNLFSDRDGNTALGNPFTANADGSIEFYVAPGRYKVVATKGGETVTWDNQLIGTVHGAEHLWKLATVEIITVAGNASSPTDDAYSADLGGNLSDGDTFRARIANANETTTPTFENTGGTPGALTITAYDGRPLWPGALEGDHRFQYEAGTSPETWLVLDPNEMGVVDPEHATDGSSPTNDEYVSAVNTDPPADGQVTTRDFRTANETTTPTLDGKTMTTKDGSALWAGAVSGVHDVQYDSGADTYLVLEPLPTAANVNNAPVARDSNGRAKFADPSAAQDVATKTWTETNRLALPATSSDPSLAFDTWRTPNANRPTLVIIETSARTDGSANALIQFQVDESGGTTADYNPIICWADTGLGSNGDMKSTNTFIIPAGGSYRVDNAADPASNNSIQDHREFTL